MIPTYVVYDAYFFKNSTMYCYLNYINLILFKLYIITIIIHSLSFSIILQRLIFFCNLNNNQLIYVQVDFENKMTFIKKYYFNKKILQKNY